MSAEGKRYEIGNKEGRDWIKCLTCKMMSYNQGDVDNRYCHKCGVFHEDEERISKFYNREDQNKDAI